MPTIAVLEDNADRRAVMERVLAEDWREYKHQFFFAAPPMIEWLNRNLGDTQLVILDHDLELIPNADGSLHDPGTGRDLSEYLARNRAVIPVLLHSSNAPAVAGMADDLEQAGIQFEIVTPYEDTVWIREAWRPAVRRLLAAARIQARSASE